MKSILNRHPRISALLTVFITIFVWNTVVLNDTVAESIPEIFFLIPLVVVVIFFIIAVFYGRRIPSYFRWIITGYFVAWGIYAALLGRTVDVGNNVITLSAAIHAYAVFALILQVALIRLISKSPRNLLLFILYPFGVLAFAFILASAEEEVFKLVHKDGIDFTARWTVSPSWLAYDANLDMLRGGSD